MHPKSRRTKRTHRFSIAIFLAVILIGGVFASRTLGQVALSMIGRHDLLAQVIGSGSSLIGRWTFEGQSCSSATTVNDQSGNSINLSVLGTNWKTSTVYEGSCTMKWGSTGNYLSAGDILDMGTSDRSISFWFTADQSGTPFAFISKGNNSSQPGRFYIAYCSGTTSAVCHSGVTGLVAGFQGATVDNNTTPGVTTGNASLLNGSTNSSVNGGYHHAVAVWDRDGMLSLWVDGGVNGQPQATLNISADSDYVMNNSSSLFFGKMADNTLFFGSSESRMDDVRIYNRVLSPSEIADLDKAAPQRYAGAPSGTLVSGTTSATLSLVTDIAATCKYSTTAGVAYTSMTDLFTTTGGTSHAKIVTGLTNGSSYNYYVRCSANNITDYPISFSVSAGADTAPPTISITAPGAGSVSGMVSVTASASDNVGVAGVQFKVDGANLQAEDVSSPYSISWDTASAGVGSHTLTAVARDVAGNVTTSNGVVVSVSNPNATFGNSLIKRVGSDDTINTAPLGTTVIVDALASQNANPATFTSLDTAVTHTATFTDTSGYAKTAGTCSYIIGGAECVVTVFTLTPTCNGTTCSQTFTTTNGQVTKVVVRYLSAVPPTPSAPAASTGGTCGGQNIVAWTTVAGATLYKLYRDGGTFNLLGGGYILLTFTDIGLPPSTTHTYKLVATNGAGDSAQSPASAGANASAACTGGDGTYIGPLAWWKFDECEPDTHVPASCPDAPAADSSGNNKPLTVNRPGGDPWSNSVGPAIGTGALRLSDSNNTYLKRTPNGGDEFDMRTEDFSASFWIKTDDTTYTALSKGPSTSAAGRYYIAGNSSGLYAGFQGSSNNVSTTPFPGVNNGSWHFVTVVWDRDANISVWVDGGTNGQPQRTASISGGAEDDLNSTWPFVVGAWSSLTNSYSDFFLDDMRLYGRVISPSEIADLFGTAPHRFNGAPSGVLAAGATTTVLSLNTDLAATCRYSTTPNVAYSSMVNTFTTTGGTSHSKTITIGSTYNYYIRCSRAAVVNTTDYLISFTIGADTGNSLIKRVGSDDTINTAPLGTTVIVDALASQNANPATFTSLDTVATHTATFTDTTGYAKTAGTCSYIIGGAECVVTVFTLTPTCNGTTCSQTFTTTNGQVTKVVVKYVDIAPPTVVITAPTNNSTVSNTVTVAATALDNVGVSGVQFKLDGVDLQTEDVGAPYSISWDTTASTLGIHSLTAVARDAAGNVTTSAEVFVTIVSAPAPRCGIGYRMRTLSTAPIYSTPSTSGSSIGSQPQSSLTRIVVDPATSLTSPYFAEGKWWCYGNFDAGVDGWVIDTYLVRVNTATYESL